MLTDDRIHNGLQMERKSFNERVTREGLELWKKQKEYERQRKMKEQKEVLNFVFFLMNLSKCLLFYSDERNVRQILAVG